MFFEEFERGGGCIGCMYYEQNELGYFKCEYPWFDTAVEKEFCKNCNSILLKCNESQNYSCANKVIEKYLNRISGLKKYV